MKDQTMEPFIERSVFRALLSALREEEARGAQSLATCLPPLLSSVCGIEADIPGLASPNIGKPVVTPSPEAGIADTRFRAYAAEHGITILRRIAAESCAFLAYDADGIVKFFKHLAPIVDDRHRNDAEDAINDLLRGSSGIPTYYGVLDIGEGITFLRFGVSYGQSLLAFALPEHRPTPDETRFIIGHIAEALTAAHARGVAHCDLRPENVHVNARDVTLHDFGDARRIPSLRDLIPMRMRDARYAPPEIIRQGMGGAPSDIFQLGVIFHELLTGAHPFVDDEAGPDDSSPMWCHVYALANAFLAFDDRPSRSCDVGASALIARMLNRDPLERPTAEEIARTLRVASPTFAVVHPARPSPPATHGTIFFPARMGVPHRGHIEFLSRILDLGYTLLVSFQRTYFHSADDPIPKWLVQKMVARSLAKRGYDQSFVRFICTPFFETDERHRMHFTMIDDFGEIIAIASGNLEITRLFGGHLPILDQRIFFGNENEAYDVRSWGAQLRSAIREGDHTTFDDLIADGATDILSFNEMRAYCLNPPAPGFVWGDGPVMVTLDCGNGSTPSSRRVSAYETPEDAAFRMLPGAMWLNRRYRNPLIFTGGDVRRLCLQSIERGPSNGLRITYVLS